MDNSVVPTKTCTTFENFLIKISLHKDSFYFLNINRPPSSSTSTFFEQFQSLLEDIHHTTENLVIIGDFNFHLESISSNSITFNSLSDSFDLTQKVNFPTHTYGHTLNLVLTKSNNDNISNVHTTDAFSDHFSITCTLNLPTPRSQISATVTFPKYHKINKEKMKTDLIASDLINNPSKEAVIAAKETKGLFERIWRRNKSHFNRSQYMQKVHQYNRIFMQAKFEKFKITTMTQKNYGESLAMCYTDCQPRCHHRLIPLGSSLTDLWSSLQKKLKNTLSFSYFPEVTTHLPRLSSPHAFHFL